MLTDRAFIRRLDSLYLLARKVLSGSLQADRTSTRRGTGVTFTDYAEYYFGADYRAIDWRVFARFGDLIIKLFEVEEDATIHIMLDRSRSMNAKFPYALQLAAALGYIALNNLDRLAVHGLGETLTTILERSRGRTAVMPLLNNLEACQTLGGDSKFNGTCRLFQAQNTRRSVVIVISDFLFPDGFDEGLSYLQWHNHDIYCLQVQSDEDTRCDWKGDVELECVETAQRHRLTITAREAQLYEQAVADWNQKLKRSCASRGIGLAATTPEISFDRVIQDILRRGGLVA
jgi:uncharacterized protein (DUF58 family)